MRFSHFFDGKLPLNSGIILYSAAIPYKLSEILPGSLKTISG